MRTVLLAEQELAGLMVTVELGLARRNLTAHIYITKRWDAPPLTGSEVAVVVEMEGGELLEPLRWPDDGPWPEVGSAAATASGEYGFRPGGRGNLRRVIVAVRGRWAEFEV